MKSTGTAITQVTAKQKAKMFKVIGHRPFDNNCTSVNIIAAETSELAKKSMVEFYGYRNEDDEEKMKPNVIIDEIVELKA